MPILWGPATWFFFHAFAEKIDPNFYIRNRGKCLDMVKNICGFIPCPQCRNHSLRFLRKYKPYHLGNKDDFINFIWVFHNHVNKSTGKPVKDKSILEKYKKGNMITFLKFFRQDFVIRNTYGHRYNVQMAMKAYVKGLFNWIIQNLKHFTP